MELLQNIERLFKDIQVLVKKLILFRCDVFIPSQILALSIQTKCFIGKSKNNSFEKKIIVFWKIQEVTFLHFYLARVFST